MFIFFKRTTAYEMRISDWSSDVCSSDLAVALQYAVDRHVRRGRFRRSLLRRRRLDPLHHTHAACPCFIAKKALMSPAESAVKARILGNQIGRASCRERVCQYV